MIRSNTFKVRTSDRSTLDDGPSTKRPRSYKLADESLRLNDTGISNMLRGQVDEAESCFTRALHHLEGKSCDSPADHNASDAFSVVMNDCFFAKTSSSVSKKLSPANPQHEYDEGMNPFNEALPICNTTSESINSATLLYNVGQTHLRRRQYHEAYRAFAFAEKRMKECSDHDGLQLKSMVFHNKGYSLYRLGMLDESLMVFENAKIESLNACLPDIYSASACNAIAVILFHSTSDNKSDCMNLLQKSLSIFQSFYGNQSVQVATVLNNIGRVHFSLGEFASSLEAYEKSLFIRRLVLGSFSIDLAAP